MAARGLDLWGALEIARMRDRDERRRRSWRILWSHGAAYRTGESAGEALRRFMLDTGHHVTEARVSLVTEGAPSGTEEPQ